VALAEEMLICELLLLGRMMPNHLDLKMDEVRLIDARQSIPEFPSSLQASGYMIEGVAD
jgi:hypothetical protein